MEQNSPSKKLNIYDVYAGLREFGILVVASLISNIGGVESFLININCPEVVSTMILFFIVEVGRRYFKNYSKGK